MKNKFLLLKPFRSYIKNYLSIIIVIVTAISITTVIISLFFGKLKAYNYNQISYSGEGVTVYFKEADFIQERRNHNYGLDYYYRELRKKTSTPIEIIEKAPEIPVAFNSKKENEVILIKIKPISFLDENEMLIFNKDAKNIMENEFSYSLSQPSIKVAFIVDDKLSIDYYLHDGFAYVSESLYNKIFKKLYPNKRFYDISRSLLITGGYNEISVEEYESVFPQNSSLSFLDENPFDSDNRDYFQIVMNFGWLQAYVFQTFFSTIIYAIFLSLFLIASVFIVNSVNSSIYVTRIKEFKLYSFLGMTKKQISKILLIEQTIIFSAIAAISMIIILFINKILSVVEITPIILSSVSNLTDQDIFAIGGKFILDNEWIVLIFLLSFFAFIFFINAKKEINRINLR